MMSIDDCSTTDQKETDENAVAWQFQDREGEWHLFVNETHKKATIKDGSWPIRALYTSQPSGMTTDELRAIFEAHYPLPAGVAWDGDHFEADRTVIGSHTNATAWGLLWRGFRSCAKEFGHAN